MPALFISFLKREFQRYLPNHQEWLDNSNEKIKKARSATRTEGTHPWLSMDIPIIKMGYEKTQSNLENYNMNLITLFINLLMLVNLYQVC